MIEIHFNNKLNCPKKFNILYLILILAKFFFKLPPIKLRIGADDCQLT